ncbi:MAG: SurA N-terminal domain-containing protein, partial [Pseudomonadota bacterium]
QNIARFQLEQLDIDQLRQSGVVDISLQQLIAQATNHNLAQTMGVSVHDDTIREVLQRTPTFQDDLGQFDANRFYGVLGQVGLREDEFVDRLRNDIGSNWIMTSYAQPLGLGDKALSRLAQWRLQLRDIAFIRRPIDRTRKIDTPDLAVLADFLAQNPESYREPERRKIKHVTIKPAQFLEGITIDDASLADAFNARADEFQKSESRVISQILFQSQEQAEQAHQHINEGTAFVDLPEALDDSDLAIVTYDDA